MNTLNSPLETRSFALQAREAILDLVIKGDIELDQTLSTDSVGKQLGGVSRTPVREALVSFGVMGIVTVKPKIGFTINSVSSTSMAEWMRIGYSADYESTQRLKYDQSELGTQ